MSVTTDVSVAVAALSQGKLCAIPTETVYGLAANALDPAAVARVFEAKERPADHPLIVHVASAKDVAQWITNLPQWAMTLIEQVWPGPLTIVGSRTALASDAVTGGQDTVAVRVPSHPIAQKVLNEVKANGVLGLVAPSANRFGHVSPTSSRHVVADLGQYLDTHQDLILEGGECQVGLESTIVFAGDEFPVILRPGAITSDDILRITGIAVAESLSAVPRVSGALDSHYSPIAKVVLITDPAQIDQTNAGFLALVEIDTPSGVHRLAAPRNLEEYAHQLYSALRSADDLSLETIYVIPPSGTGLAQAINDRLQRAAY